MRKEGDQGEAAARAVLVRAGFVILKNNFCVRGGEIDIVARAPDGEIIFVEVKLRAREPVDHAALIPWQKKQRLQRAGSAFLSQHHVGPARYDLILLIPRPHGGAAQVFWHKDVCGGVY